MDFPIQNQARPRPFLSICIPTYNRGACVAERLAELAKQANTNVEVVVCDNASGDDTGLVLENLGSQFSNFRAYRGTVNEGFALNVRRCVEQASGEWLWITGDDDPIAGNAVETIIRCARESESPLLYFSNPCSRITETRTITKVAELLSGIPLSGLVLLGATVYRREVLSGNMAGFGQFSSSMLPYLCITLGELEAGRVSVKTQKEKIFADDAYHQVQSWSSMKFVENFGNWLSACQRAENRGLLARELWFYRTWGLEFGQRELRNTETLKRWRMVYWVSVAVLLANSGNPFRDLAKKFLGEAREAFRWCKGQRNQGRLPNIFVAFAPSKWVLARVQSDTSRMADIY